MIALGAPAPEFELEDQNGKPISSSTLRGKNVLPSFHPLTWTGVCQRQMEALEMNTSVFAELNTQAFGVSIDSVPCRKAWAESINVKTPPLLADSWPHGGLAQSLGLFRDTDGISRMRQRHCRQARRCLVDQGLSNRRLALSRRIVARTEGSQFVVPIKARP